MPNRRTTLFALFVISSFTYLRSQTLHPGDFGVVSIATDLGSCGFPAGSDEISFICFQDLQNGTTFEMTDNGYEQSFAGLWGNQEGTLSITRTGGAIPKGTIMTLRCINLGAGNFSYQFVSPDNNFAVGNINLPGGGPFDLDPNGDQVFWMFGGAWNYGAGVDQGTYDGVICYGFNTLSTWNADGTIHQSNLPPDLAGCFYVTASPGALSSNYFEYDGHPNGNSHFTLLQGLQDQSVWKTYTTCTNWENNAPDYTTGSITIVDDPIGIHCGLVCNACPNTDYNISWTLPPGNYNVWMTNGTDTLEFMNIHDSQTTPVGILGTVTWTVVAVEEVGGCKIFGPFQFPAVTINSEYHDPGLHNDLWLCPTFTGPIELFYQLLGTPDMGGTWKPNIAFNTYYYTQFGQGMFTYTFVHMPLGSCPNDTASVTVHFLDPSSALVDVSCDQNGTPNDIYDDVTVITLHWPPDPYLPELAFSITSGGGTVMPTTGVTGQDELLYLQPGSAIGNPVTLHVQSFSPFNCPWDFVINPPGYCSDPCDYGMTSTIYGPEDICLKNCPDNPLELTLEVNGGTPPYTMDFTLNATGYAPWVFTGVNVNDVTDIRVCMDSVPAPVFNPTTYTLTLPNFLGDSYVTFSIGNVFDKFGCTSILDPAEHSLYVHKLPQIKSTNLAFCWEEAKNVNLTDYDLLINPFLDVTWWDGNPFDGGQQIFNATGANLHNVNQLWAHVADDYCENSIRVPFTIYRTPRLDSIPPIQLCEGTPIKPNAIPIHDAANSGATYTFHNAFPPDSTNLIDSAYYLPLTTDTIYVVATNWMCHDTLPIILVVQPYPTFTLEGVPCNLLQNTFSVLFTSSADSIATTAGIVHNHPVGQDSIIGIPENTNITIYLFNPSRMCKDTFAIVAPNCNCPTINQPVTVQSGYQLCENDALPLLSVTVDPGLVANWYDVPSGGVPLLQNSLTFQPVNPSNATYYAEALDQNSGCYSLRTPIDININPLANLQALPDPVLCETQTINFNTTVPSVLNGVPGTGQWYNLVTQAPVSGTIVPQNGDAWYYLFTTTNGGCTTSDTITATVHAAPSFDSYNVDCIDATLLYNFYFTSDATTVGANVGTLTQIPGTDSFLLSDIPYDTDILFNLQNAVTGCSIAFTQQAPNCSCPSLLDVTATQYCSSSGVLDLSTFQGPGVSGNWQIISTPPGANPATLAGKNFNGTNGDAGLYKLRFIRSILLADCVDTAFFDLTLVHAPSADAGVNATVCAPDAIALNGTVSGTGVQFNWQENGAASIQNPNALNTSYQPTLADIQNGSVNFTLNAIDPSGVCPNAQETITINIDDNAYYILNAPAQVYCDTLNTSVDLDPLISYGVTSGTWFFPDTVSAPVTNNSIINPSTIPAGTYTIFYTSTTAVPPCKNDTTAVTLIIRNCACPSVAINNPAQSLCSETGSLDLNTLLITSEPGSWSIVSTPAGSKPATLNGTTFITNQSDAGTYRVRFSLSNPVSGCADSAEVNLVVVATPAVSIVSVQCAADLQTWEAVIQSTSPTINLSEGALTSLGNNKYAIKNITLNTALQVTASSGNGLCTKNLTVNAPDCACTLSISNLPDDVTLCPDDKITLDAQVSNGKGNVTSFWIVNNDSLYQKSLQVSQAGSYPFVSIDSLGCRVEHVVNVSYYTEMVPDASAQDVLCPGDQDGIIFLNAIIGGTGPFFISVNNGAQKPILAFPYMVTGLAPGNYQVELTDAFGCSIKFNMVIQSASSETLTLGPDISVLVGDSAVIHPVISFVPGSFTWTGDISLLDPNQLDNVIYPQQDLVIQLTATDAKGCVYSDELKIRALLHSTVYVPNVFSPNDDDINDYVVPIGDPSITLFRDFEIFDRWGEKMFEAHDFTPGSIKGWDGRFNGKWMLPGVFAYRVVAINKRDKIIMKWGDLTLVR